MCIYDNAPSAKKNLMFLECSRVFSLPDAGVSALFITALSVLTFQYDNNITDKKTIITDSNIKTRKTLKHFC